MYSDPFIYPSIATHTSISSKVWDTYTGKPLHSFPHNHIVRTVALSPTASNLLTGGQEKKVRIFDLGRPDADPDFLFDSNNNQSHDGTIKSVVWAGEHTGVTAGEDGKIKCVLSLFCLA
jgi:serine-threonine kinase receptor-associated protein